MTPLHTEALNRARQLIARDIGSLSDLPEDIQNTVANIYYQFCHMSMELEGEFAFPSAIALAKDYQTGVAQFWKESALLNAGVDTLPKIISGLRMAAKNGEHDSYSLAVQIILDIFKYRIPDYKSKSSLRVKIERPFYAAKVDEIENLWKVI